MKPKKRQKLCHNCEGEIDVDVIVCPFCAADLREEKPEQRHPPYAHSVRTLRSPEISASVPPLLSRPSSADPLPEEKGNNTLVCDTPMEGNEKREAGILLPAIFFTLGVQLCILGLLMLLISHRGEVILRWDARFWFFYVVASLPFLILGYKALSKRVL
jgi:hypothetical protein